VIEQTEYRGHQGLVDSRQLVTVQNVVQNCSNSAMSRNQPCIVQS